MWHNSDNIIYKQPFRTLPNTKISSPNSGLGLAFSILEHGIKKFSYHAL